MPGFIALMTMGLLFTLTLRLLRRGTNRRLQLEQRLQQISELEINDNILQDERLKLPFAERVFFPMVRIAGQRLQQFAPSNMKVTLEKELTKAGLKVSAEQWMGYYVLGSGSGLALGWLLAVLMRKPASTGILLGMLFGFGLGFLPRLILKQQVAKRQKQIVRALPDVLDLLTVSVKAGLGFDSALMKVTDKMKGPLSDELSKVLHEIKVGVLRKDALRSMAIRTGVNDLQSFVGTIIQADQLGVSISNVLQLQSDSLRERRRQTAEEAGMKAPVKMLFPLILFIFPTLFIVLLGPAVLQIIETLSGM